MRSLAACLSAALLCVGAGAETIVTAASSSGGDYAPASALDGDPATWWGSAAWRLPQWLRVDFGELREINRIRLAQPDNDLYARWSSVTLVLGNGLKADLQLPDRLEHEIVLPTQRTAWVELRINRTHQVRHYVGCAELACELDSAASLTPGVRLVADPETSLASTALVTTTSERKTGTYAPARLNDCNQRTYFATQEDEEALPTLRLEFPRPVTLGSVCLYGIGHTNIYAGWQRFTLSFSDGSREQFERTQDLPNERVSFASRQVSWLEIAVDQVFEPKVYVACAEVELNCELREQRDQTIFDLPPGIEDGLDVVQHVFFGGRSQTEVTVARLEAEGRREGIVGTIEPAPSPASPHYIAADLPHAPVVRAWSGYSRTIYPHMCGLMIAEYSQAAALSAHPAFAARLCELADFALWSQYDEQGNCALLDHLGIDYPRVPEHHGGWPTHDFTWTDGSDYFTPAYEPSHHMDAMTAMGLVGAYEQSGEERYLTAAETFVRRQGPWFGLHWGQYLGKPTLWTEYNPTTGGRPQYDAVDNIMALFAAPTAAVGYHRGDAELLDWAEGFLWWMCKELDLDGRWYYLGNEWFDLGKPIHRQEKTKSISHESACIEYGTIALHYLRLAGRSRPDIERRFARFAIMYYSPLGARVRKMVEGPVVAGQPLRVVCWVRLTNAVERIIFADKIPSGWPAPAEIELSVVGEDFAQTRPVTPEELAEGVPIDWSGGPGDVLRVAYSLTVPPDFAYSDDPFAPELDPYPVLLASTVVCQGHDLFTGSWYQCGAESVAQPLRTAPRASARQIKAIPYLIFGARGL
ncbi:MAG: discoidin domain-containing protein [Armatimonadota bacterium]